MKRSAWFSDAFDAAAADIQQAQIELAMSRGEPEEFDRVLLDKLFPDKMGERVHLARLEKYHHDHPREAEPHHSEQDHSIDR